MGSLSGARIGALALVCASVLAACGGGDDASSDAEAEATPPTADEVVAAFEEAAGGYEFEKATSLVNRAVAYAPHNSADPDELAPINEALGDSSILWQVFIFEGEGTPVDEAAVQEVGSASDEDRKSVV